LNFRPFWIAAMNLLRSDQIGVEEIRRRVDAAIIEVETLPIQTGPPADGKRPGVRDLARLVKPRLDADCLEAIQREGLVRFVRRVQRLKRNRPNKIKQARK